MLNHIAQVRDPDQRLGCGSAGPANDMAALKIHELFHTLHWGSLWTDPAPPLEAGLLKKEHPLSPQQPDVWDNVTDAWDRLAEQEDSLTDDEDEIPWAADAQGPNVLIKRQDPAVPQNVEIGPMGEIRATKSIVIQANGDTGGSSSTASPASSSDGSPMGRLNTDMGKLQPFQTAEYSSLGASNTMIAVPSGDIPEPEHARGRSPMQTPVQGHGPPVEL